MRFRVEELAARAGVRVDTMRFYQSRGLLPPPEREGRVAFYGEGHLARLRRIRSLLGQGFRLAQIQQLLEGGEEEEPPLLQALVREHVGSRTYTRRELAAEAGIPEVLIQAAQGAGLVEPLRLDGEERFSQADLDMARAGLAILNAGLPLQELLGLAMDHARAIQAVTERAIQLFDTHVRKAPERAGNEAAVSEAFRTLLPQVTRLVALHFQRTLVNRALQRLEESREDEALRAALLAVEASSLEVQWR